MNKHGLRLWCRWVCCSTSPLLFCQIEKVIQPDNTIFVLDSTIGQAAVDQVLPSDLLLVVWWSGEAVIAHTDLLTCQQALSCNHLLRSSISTLPLIFLSTRLLLRTDRVTHPFTRLFTNLLAPFQLSVQSHMFICTRSPNISCLAL